MVRMRDIAEHAGVSRSTVSLVLNNKHASVRIPDVTRRRVLSAANQLGYRPNEMARAMVTGKNRILVYLLHNPAQEVAAGILSGALREAEQHGYLIKLVGRDGPFDKRDIERCVELRPAGIMSLYVTPSLTPYLQQETDRYQIPVVLLDSSFPVKGVVRVLSDDIAGMDQAVTHLHSLGHKRIGYLSGPVWSGSSVLREEGFKKAIARQGLEFSESRIARCEWTIESMQNAAEQLLNLRPRPTALCCVDDKTALIAARNAKRRGLRVPEDLSLVGFADLEMASYGSPPLTTIAQPFAELGVRAVRSLLEAVQRLENREEPESTDVLLSNHLIVRESTAKPPETGGTDL